VEMPPRGEGQPLGPLLGVAGSRELSAVITHRATGQGLAPGGRCGELRAVITQRGDHALGVASRGRALRHAGRPCPV